MKIKAYIDTNIIIYAVFHHREFGKYCERILFDVKNERIYGYGSYLVAIELLGSLSKIDPILAREVTKNYLAMNIKMLKIDELTLDIAGEINTIVNIGYDAIHLAIMLRNSINRIITNDIDDWTKVSRNIDKVLQRLREKNYEINVREIGVITPRDYFKSVY